MANGYFSEYAKDEEETKCQLLEPLVYAKQHESTATINLWADTLYYWFQISEEEKKRYTKAANLLKTAYFTYDDIVDASTLRQGVPVPHLIYGVAHTISAVNYGFALTLQQILTWSNLDILDSYIKCMVTCLRGQTYESVWINRGTCPTEEEYLNCCAIKASAHFIMCFETLQALSEKKLDAGMSKGFMILGKTAQIINDYLDLECDKYNPIRGACADITSGLYTFPLIHAIQSHPEDDQIINILKEKTKDDEKKKYCVSLLKKYGSLDYTKKKVGEMVQMAADEFKKYPRNPLIEGILAAFLKQMKKKATVSDFFTL